MQKLNHLLCPVGFGPRSKSWDNWMALPPSWWPKIKDESMLAPQHFDVADGAIKGLLMGVGEIGKMEKNDLINILYQQQLLTVIRDNALGNFRDLLRAFSKSAAMLAFLNNQQQQKSRKSRPFEFDFVSLHRLSKSKVLRENLYSTRMFLYQLQIRDASKRTNGCDHLPGT